MNENKQDWIEKGVGYFENKRGKVVIFWVKNLKSCVTNE